jgi:hypothetical protein
MKLERRDKANDCIRSAQRKLPKPLVRPDGCARYSIEPAAEALDFALFEKPGEITPPEAMLFGTPNPTHPGFFNVFVK